MKYAGVVLAAFTAGCSGSSIGVATSSLDEAQVTESPVVEEPVAQEVVEEQPVSSTPPRPAPDALRTTELITYETSPGVKHMRMGLWYTSGKMIGVDYRTCGSEIACEAIDFTLLHRPIIKHDGTFLRDGDDGVMDQSYNFHGYNNVKDCIYSPGGGTGGDVCPSRHIPVTKTSYKIDGGTMHVFWERFSEDNQRKEFHPAVTQLGTSHVYLGWWLEDGKPIDDAIFFHGAGPVYENLSEVKGTATYQGLAAGQFEVKNKDLDKKERFEYGMRLTMDFESASLDLHTSGSDVSQYMQDYFSDTTPGFVDGELVLDMGNFTHPMNVEGDLFTPEILYSDSGTTHTFHGKAGKPAMVGGTFHAEHLIRSTKLPGNKYEYEIGDTRYKVRGAFFGGRTE